MKRVFFFGMERKEERESERAERGERQKKEARKKWNFFPPSLSSFSKPHPSAP
jgi:hypothetical protein